MKTPEQLKGTIRSMAAKKNLRPQESLRRERNRAEHKGQLLYGLRRRPRQSRVPA